MSDDPKMIGETIRRMAEAIKDKPEAALLPCPWCGCEPNIKHDKDAEQGAGWWFVYHTEARSEKCPAFCWTGASTEEEVVKRWNRRAEPPRSYAEQAFLEAAKALGNQVADSGWHLGAPAVTRFVETYHQLRALEGKPDA